MKNLYLILGLLISIYVVINIQQYINITQCDGKKKKETKCICVCDYANNITCKCNQTNQVNCTTYKEKESKKLICPSQNNKNNENNENNKNNENNLLKGLQIEINKLNKYLISKGFSKDIEGNSGEFIEEQKKYLDIAVNPLIKNVCEIGFNAGHSSVLFLWANKNIKLYSFDLGNHDYTIPAATYLREIYHDRLELILGFSSKTVPKWIDKNIDIKCNVLIIDGGHKYREAITDLKNFAKLADEFNILIIDDTPCKSFFCKGK